MSNRRLVWSDKEGDVRKKTDKKDGNAQVNEAQLELRVRRLTSGKGRTVVEITGLPNNKAWCKQLAKDLKKALGVGGSFKDNYIEIHGEKLDKVTELLDSKKLKWKKTGG